MFPFSEKEIKTAYSFNDYINLIDMLLADGKSTGPNGKKYFDYGKINRQRMKRIHQLVEFDSLVIQAAQNITPQYWIIITEGWCGDAAQIVPVLERLSELSEGNIITKYILRDENPLIMNEYLTNGGKSIPILISLNQSDLQEQFVWGPRPAELQRLRSKWIEEGIENEEVAENLQGWYNRDKGIHLQNELLEKFGHIKSPIIL